jgi:hypothetical protein
VIVDDAKRKIVMYYHGLGPKLPNCHCNAAAESLDGLTFQAGGDGVILEDTYLRIFSYQGEWYGFARAGVLYRTSDQ